MLYFIIFFFSYFSFFFCTFFILSTTVDRCGHKKFKTFKKSKSVLHEEIYKDSKYFVRKLIKNKKKVFFENKLKENIGKPKELWKTLKSLGLPQKNNPGASICLNNDGKHSFDAKNNSEIFKDFFGNLAENLIKKLPSSPNLYGINSLFSYYKNLNLDLNIFKFDYVSEEVVIDLLNNVEPSKAAGIDNINGRFIKDGANVLAHPVTQLCNLSIKLSSFPLECKIAKLKPIYKKGSKTDPKNFRPISLLPLISKIIEKVIHDQTEKYLSSKNILFQYQSGFCKHHSTDFCLSILFTSKRKVQLVKKLNITYNNIPIKQHTNVSYLGCILDNTLSGESMALNVINKVNSKLRFLYRNKSFLNPQLRRLMCNALIQPHFDYASSTWYLNLTEKF